MLNLLSWLIATVLVLDELRRDFVRPLAALRPSGAGCAQSGICDSAGTTRPAVGVCTPPPCEYTGLAPADQVLMPMLARFCISDGAVSQEEIDFVETFLRDGMGLNAAGFDAAAGLFNLATESSVPFEDFLVRYSRLVGLDTPPARATMDAFLALALRDGVLQPAEERLLDAMARAMSLRYSSYHEFVLRQRAARKRAEGTNDVASCLRILGLNPGATLRDAENAYKCLACQYHPDRVQHLGPKLRDLAELEMKRLNGARDVLRQHLE